MSSEATTRSVTPESVDCPRRGRGRRLRRGRSATAPTHGPGNRSRTAFSDAPTHLSISSAPLTVCTDNRPDAARPALRTSCRSLAVRTAAPARRFDAQAGERVGMLQRPQDGLGERLLVLHHVADVVEGDRTERDVGRVTPRHRPDHFQRPCRSASRSIRASPVLSSPLRDAVTRAAAMDRGLGNQRGQVGATKPGAGGDSAQVQARFGRYPDRIADSSRARSAASGRPMMISSRSHNSGSRRRPSTAAAGGGTPAPPNRRRSRPQLVEDQRRHGFGRSGQQRLHVGDEEHSRPVARRKRGDRRRHRRQPRRRLQRTHRRTVDHGQHPARAPTAPWWPLADAGGPDADHPEAGWRRGPAPAVRRG